MGIKTVPHRPYNPDLGPCDFWLFPKLRGCRYETIEMKEAMTKVIDMLTQDEFHGAFQKLLERYNKCIAAVGDYFEGYQSSMRVLSIKVPIRKKYENYLWSSYLKPFNCARKGIILTRIISVWSQYLKPFNLCANKWALACFRKLATNY